MGFIHKDKKAYHSDGSWSSTYVDDKFNLVHVGGRGKGIDYSYTSQDIGDGIGIIFTRVIPIALVVLAIVALFAYNLPGIMLTSTVSAPMILLSLVQGNGLGWIPVAVWVVACIISMLGSTGYHNDGERRVFITFAISAWLASIALLVYAVHFAGMTALNPFSGGDFLACLSQILFLQLQIIVPTLALSTLFMIFSFRITLIVSSLRMNSLLLPGLLLLPIVTRLLMDDWYEVTYASVAGNLEPLLGALQLNYDHLNAWILKLTPILAEVTIQQQLIAAGVLFVALQLIALILSFIPHRK